LHLVGSSILLYLIDDARSNKNQISINHYFLHLVGFSFTYVSKMHGQSNLTSKAILVMVSVFRRPVHSMLHCM